MINFRQQIKSLFYHKSATTAMKTKGMLEIGQGFTCPTIKIKVEI